MALRSATAEDHAALEQTRIMLEVSSGAPTVAEFAEYLERQWSLHVALEPALAPWVPATWIDERLVKRHWLKEDLRALGRTTERPARAIPAFSSTAEALGSLYVLEGSTLGLRLIERRLTPGHPALDDAGHFIRGYGPDNGVRWKHFLDRLEQLPEAEWPAAISAAQATFALFLKEFADRPPSG
jgi:heme oxygenase